MNRRIVGALTLVLVAVAITTSIFFYAKGYRIDFNQKTISGTGIIQIASQPKGVAVYLNDEQNPRDATDVSLTNLAPGDYTLRLSREGFIDWKKKISVKAGLVTRVEALLFPSAPNLKAVTFSGVLGPKISPDNQILVYSVTEKGKEGLWVLDLRDRPLFFSKEPKQIVKDSPGLAFSKASYLWSAESKSVLVTLKTSGGEVNYLLETNTLNEQFTDISAQVASLKATWSKDTKVKEEDRLENLGDEAKKLVQDARKILFSPEEERILIVQKDGKALVYDSKPYLAFEKKPQTFALPKADNYLWYPENSQSGHDSRHLILIRKDSISLVEADGENEMTIYTGDFDPNSVFAWPNGSKLLITTTLNSSTNKQPNLYSIELR